MMDEKELFDRLPDDLFHDGVELIKHKGDDTSLRKAMTFHIETGDPFCDPELSWSGWVAFAEKIIAANKAAHAPGPGEIVQFSKRLLGEETRIRIFKLEDLSS